MAAKWVAVKAGAIVYTLVYVVYATVKDVFEQLREQQKGDLFLFSLSSFESMRLLLLLALAFTSN